MKTPGFGVIIQLKDVKKDGIAKITISAAKQAPPRPPRHHEHDGDHGKRGRHH